MNEEKIRELVSNVVLKYEDLFFIDLKIKKESEYKKLIVFVDGDKEFTIQKCGMISKEIGSKLEMESILDEKYRLEVSSPGLDFPLILPRQYKKNIGRELLVTLVDDKVISGELMEVDGQGFVLSSDEGTLSMKWSAIKFSKIKIKFK